MYRLHSSVLQEAGNDGNQGGGAGNAGGAGSDGGNNTPNNVNPWAAPGNMGGNAGNANQQGGNVNQGNQAGNAGQAGQAGNANDPAAAFANHIKSLNLLGGIDFNQIATDIAQGDASSLQSAVESAVVAAIQQSVMSANRLVDKRADEVGKKAAADATGQLNSDMAFQRVVENMPFLGDAEMAPVTKATIASLFRQGQSLEDVVGNATKYFQQMGGKMATHFSASGQIPDDIPGLGAFQASGAAAGSNKNGIGAGGDDVDWVGLFAPDQAANN